MCEGIRPQPRGLRRYDALGVTASTSRAQLATVILDVRALQYATEKLVVDKVLRRRPGVHRVTANPVSQTATVTFDQARISVRELARCLEECGYYSVGQSVPAHLYDPLVEPVPTLHPPEEGKRR